MRILGKCFLRVEINIIVFLLTVSFCFAIKYPEPPPPGQQSLTIIVTDSASSLEHFAARELRKYIYLRTGTIVPIKIVSKSIPDSGNLIVLGIRRHPVIDRLIADAWLEPVALGLKPYEYIAQEIIRYNQRIQLLAGSDDVGVLYAAYRFAENLGVRFYLHGDHFPSDRLSIVPVDIEPKKGAQLLMQEKRIAKKQIGFFSEVGKPLFNLRGIQPFHDFPEGPDWWNKEEYRAIISQLPKLRMNFIGLHTYPEKHPNAEPTVWIGMPEDIGENGKVKFAYPASYQNTLRGNWGYKAKKTSDFTFGSANLFERDDFGAELMWGLMPEPATAEGCIEIFNRTGELLRSAFEYAHQLGIKTCVGTETPLIVPKLVADRLKDQGKNPAEISSIELLYEGIFKWITQNYPLDYYWFWTPEDWTWKGTKPEQVTNTLNDLFAAIRAHKKVDPPFALATCGWVLGPQQDRALFDKVLPKDVALSCINREVGKTPVEKGFAKVQGRSKWAIPWLEDDPALTSPQLWVGRMRRDAADALKYGCDGLMGIHWRTRVLGPAVSALAKAAWDQSKWNTNYLKMAEPKKVEGPVGGKYADFPKNEISGTQDPVIYQSVRYDVEAYHFNTPDGTYTVTLKFCEPHYNEKGKRIFGVKIQDKTVIENLDIFEKVGKNRALDYTFKDIAVTNGWLDIEFIYQQEYPCIAAIVIEGKNYVRKINCGGKPYKDYQADWQPAEKIEVKSPPTDDFYLDWATVEFGADVAEDAAKIFQKIDGKLPRPSDWVEGPGGTRPDSRPWEIVKKDYWFVDEFASLRPKVKGKAELERFDYWLNTFKYMQAMAKVNCTWSLFTNVLHTVKQEKDTNLVKELIKQKVFPVRRQIIEELKDVYQYLLATVSNTGELGTIANWEQHIYTDLLVKPAVELEKILGEKLPDNLHPPKEYTGATRLIVPTVRTSLLRDEPLNLKIIILSKNKPVEADIFWRPLGRGNFKKTPLTNVNRGVYKAFIYNKGIASEDLEYYVRVKSTEGQILHYPVTAPLINQVVTRLTKLN